MKPVDPAQLTRPISVREIFCIGIGPSSSHTVGPMRAARLFTGALGDALGSVRAVSVELFGSLALTGKGHRTDEAVMLGLAGHDPETIDPDAAPALVHEIRQARQLRLGGAHAIAFSELRDIRFHRAQMLAGHPNALRFTACGAGLQRSAVYFSVGGGAVHAQDGAVAPDLAAPQAYPFDSAAQLVRLAHANGMRIAQLVLANEAAWRDEARTRAYVQEVRAAMHACIDRGCAQQGTLPGGLGVRRRAHDLARRVRSVADEGLRLIEQVSVYALAVNEENAAGARVVTAPTNGAAGVIPAVLRYYESSDPDASEEKACEFLLTAAAIGMLYKKRASISAAEMGCQGEIGVACSMAAAALAAVRGGTPQQVANAAEIGMEHHLGLTCDPVAGLVQVPCIERNAMAAVKAIQAAHLALAGDGRHLVSLDAVIETMRQTGLHMRMRYKETGLGGLAVNVVAC